MRRMFILQLLILFILETQVIAAEPAIGIMKKWDQQLSASDEKSIIKMTLINRNAEKRFRMIERMMKTDESGQRKILIKFNEPSEIKNTRLLTLANKDRNDDQFFYLPVLKKIRRMSANNEKDRFVGSDLTFGDLKVEQFDLFNYKLLKEEKIDGKACYVIVATPKEEKTVQNTGYKKRIFWISKDNLVDLKREYYDMHDKLIKIFKNDNILKFESKETTKYRPKTITIENVQENHKTVLLFNQIVLDSGLKDNLFTKRYLNR